MANFNRVPRPQVSREADAQNYPQTHNGVQYRTEPDGSVSIPTPPYRFAKWGYFWEFANAQPVSAQPAMEAAVIAAQGVQGRLELLENRIRITRKGLGAFFVHGLKGDKEILLSKIGSIQFRKAGAITNGYIQFSLTGGNESQGGIWDAARDENTVMFDMSQQQAFINIKQAIEQRINTQLQGQASTSKLDELAKLATLRDQGIVSEEEFTATKKRPLEL